MYSKSWANRVFVAIFMIYTVISTQVFAMADQRPPITPPLTELTQHSVLNYPQSRASSEIEEITATFGQTLIAAAISDFNFSKELVATSVAIWPQHLINRLKQDNTKTIKPLQPIYLTNGDIIKCLAWRNTWRNKWDNCYYLATGSNLGYVNLLKIQTDGIFQNLSSLQIDGVINSLVWDASGDYLIVGADSKDVSGKLFGQLFIYKFNDPDQQLSKFDAYQFDNAGITINGVSCSPLNTSIVIAGQDLSVQSLVNWWSRNARNADYVQIYKPNGIQTETSSSSTSEQSALFNIVKFNSFTRDIPKLLIAQVTNQDPCSVNLYVMHNSSEIIAPTIVRSPTPIQNLSVEWLNGDTILIVHDNYNILKGDLPPKFKHKAAGSSIYSFNITNKTLTHFDNLPDIYVSCIAVQPQMLAFGSTQGLVFVK